MIQLIALLLISNPSFASDGGDLVGNGGLGIVCRNDGKVVSAEVLDVFEAKLNGPCNQPSTQDSTTTIKNLMDQIALTTGASRSFLEIDFGIITSQIAFHTSPAFDGITKDHGLKNPRIYDHDQCKLEQIGVYQTEIGETGQLIIDEGIFEKLSGNEKSAFLVHETLYYYLRASNQIKWYDSTVIRKMVGDAFCGIEPKLN